MTPARRRSKARERFRTVFFMFAVTVVFGAAVSALHVYTAPLVQRNSTLFLKRAVRAAAGLDPVADAELEQWYARSVTPLPAGAAEPACYRVVGQDDGRPSGFVFIRSGSGLWGKIRAAVGLDGDLHSLTGTSVIDQNETPGLGARIAEPWFQKQVAGKRGPLTLAAEGTRSTDPHTIDAITGATITSQAMRGILNRTLAESTNVVEQAGGGADHGNG